MRNLVYDVQEILDEPTNLDVWVIYQGEIYQSVRDLDCV